MRRPTDAAIFEKLLFVFMVPCSQMLSSIKDIHIYKESERNVSQHDKSVYGLTA